VLISKQHLILFFIISFPDFKSSKVGMSGILTINISLSLTSDNDGAIVINDDEVVVGDAFVDGNLMSLHFFRDGLT